MQCANSDFITICVVSFDHSNRINPVPTAVVSTTAVASTAVNNTTTSTTTTTSTATAQPQQQQQRRYTHFYYVFRPHRKPHDWKCICFHSVKIIVNSFPFTLVPYVNVLPILSSYSPIEQKQPHHDSRHTHTPTSQTREHATHNKHRPIPPISVSSAQNGAFTYHTPIP